MPDQNRLSLERIEAAPAAIGQEFQHTPQYRAEQIDHDLGCRLIVKVECVNPIRSFKGRGAELFFASAEPATQIVCASAGNFGQAMAYAARRRRRSLIVYAAESANTFKVERMRALGAEVRIAGADFDAAKLAAKAFCEESGAQMVEDGLAPACSEGAATIALELLRYPEPIDTLVVPLGNGAMLGGIARYAKAVRPDVEIIGVCPQGAPSMEQSWRSGTTVELPSIDTVADGIGVRVPIPEALDDLRHTLDDILLVSDTAMLNELRVLHRGLGLVVEPSGSAGLAAIRANPERFGGKLVATVLCGGNLTAEQIQEWL